MGYDATLHTESNKSYGRALGGPTDARSYYYDTGTYQYRYYLDESEVDGYLTGDDRKGNFSVYIQRTGSTLVEEWWYKDGVTLVPRVGPAGPGTAGMVELATDADMQVTAAPPDNIKVPTALRIFNWWNWIRTAAALPVQTIAARWRFTSLAGPNERVMSATKDGDLLANYDLMEQIVTDGDIVTACDIATYISGQGTPKPANGKIFNKGQFCKGTGAYLYFAYSDQVALRIPLA